MKKSLKKVTAVLLCLVISMTCCVSAFGASNNIKFSTGELKILSYNVGGLPIPSIFGGRNVYNCQKEIGTQLSNSNYDIVNVQEDFDLHFVLDKAVTNMKNRTITNGGIAIGDGLNAFSEFPIYNVTRTTWNASYGVLDGGQDALTPKGILYYMVEIEEGIYIDVYNIHADAYEDEKSLAARRDNFTQLAQLINSRSADRAVIVTGDFNARLCREYDQLYALLVEPANLKDAWAQTANGGIYPGFSDQLTEGEWWGITDSVDRVLYRNGGGVVLNAKSHEYKFLSNAAGEGLSDHAACSVTLSYAYAGTPQVDENAKEQKIFLLDEIARAFKQLAKCLKLIIADAFNLISK